MLYEKLSGDLFKFLATLVGQRATTIYNESAEVRLPKGNPVPISMLLQNTGRLELLQNSSRNSDGAADSLGWAEAVVLASTIDF